MLIIDQLGYCRTLAADGAFPVPGNLYRAEIHFQCIPEQQPPPQRRTDVQDRLDHFGCLYRTDDARYHPENSGFLARRDHSGRRRYLEQAAVTWPFSRNDCHHLPLKPEYRGAYQRFPQHHAGIVHEITGGEVVASVNDDIIILDDILDI